MQVNIEFATKEIMERERKISEWKERAFKAEGELKFEQRMREYFEAEKKKHFNRVLELETQVRDLGGNPDDSNL
jgi:hypothetical protein